MKKLSTMLAMLAMTTALGVTGCGSKGKDEKKVDPVAKPTEETPQAHGGQADGGQAGGRR